jgi:flagellar biosynthesis anti-sigma factor FlgM
MKILPGLQQPAALTEAEHPKDQAAPTAPLKTTAKAPAARDTVDFSASVQAGLRTTPEEQARRIAALKTSIAAGTYQVSSRQVADKMLADSFEF